MEAITTDPIRKKANELIEGIRKYLDTNSVYKASTCDYANWDTNEHHAMNYLKRRTPDDLEISCSVNFGVTDWVITKK